MRGRWALAIAFCLAAAWPAPAADRELVALVPAHTFKGPAENGPVLTDAFRANLQKAGYRVADARETDAAIKRLNMDLSKPQFLPGLAALARELKVRYVVYPRIAGVGIGINQQDPEEFQATILVNVFDPAKNQFAHVFQVGQLFKHPDRSVERAVMPKEAAATAAQRVLEGFYKKVGAG